MNFNKKINKSNRLSMYYMVFIILINFIKINHIYKLYKNMIVKFIIKKLYKKNTCHHHNQYKNIIIN
jgi:hypothetical protein